MRIWRALVCCVLMATVLVTCAPAASPPPTSPPATSPAALATKPATEKAAAPAAKPPAEKATPLQPIKARVVTGGITFSRLPYYAAYANGFFKDEGLDVEPVSMASGADAAKLIASNSVDFFVGQFVDAVNVNKAGVNIKGVAMLTNKISNNIVIRKDIADKVKSMADIKGQTYVIGVASIGSGAWQFTVYMSQLSGVPKEQLNFVAVPAASVATSMKSGRINVGSYGDPEAYRMVADGDADFLIDMTDEQLHAKFIGPEYLNNQIMVSAAYMQSNPEAVQRFVNAIQRTLNWARSTSPEDIAEKLLAYPGFENFDRKLLVAVLKRMMNAVPRTSVITQAAFDGAIKLPLATGGLDAPIPFAQLVDNRFAEVAATKYAPPR